MRHSGAMSKEVTPASSEAQSPAPIAAIVAPVLAFGATYAARKVLASAYRAITGRNAPSNKDLEVSLASVVAWAAISGATVAVVEALIVRSADRYFGQS